MSMVASVNVLYNKSCFESWMENLSLSTLMINTLDLKDGRLVFFKRDKIQSRLSNTRQHALESTHENKTYHLFSIFFQTYRKTFSTWNDICQARSSHHESESDLVVVGRMRREIDKMSTLIRAYLQVFGARLSANQKPRITCP